MNIGELNHYKQTYNLDPVEVACIVLWFGVSNKTMAFSYTIGMVSKSKHLEVLATRFFARQNVQQFISDNKNIMLNNNSGDEEMFDNGTERNRTDSKQQPDPDIDITSENIKDILQSEFRKISDPDKRAVILMKIADFVGLKNSDAEDPLTPTIYLPARCSTCNLLKNNQQTNPL